MEAWLFSGAQGSAACLGKSAIVCGSAELETQQLIPLKRDAPQGRVSDCEREAVTSTHNSHSMAFPPPPPHGGLIIHQPTSPLKFSHGTFFPWAAE